MVAQFSPILNKIQVSRRCVTKCKHIKNVAVMSQGSVLIEKVSSVTKKSCKKVVLFYNEACYIHKVNRVSKNKTKQTKKQGEEKVCLFNSSLHA